MAIQINTKEYRYLTNYACGLIVTDSKDYIIDSAPIYRKLIGLKFYNLKGVKILLNTD